MGIPIEIVQEFQSHLILPSKMCTFFVICMLAFNDFLGSIDYILTESDDILIGPGEEDYFKDQV